MQTNPWDPSGIQPQLLEKGISWPADTSCLNTDKAIGYILFTLVLRKQILK